MKVRKKLKRCRRCGKVHPLHPAIVCKGKRSSSESSHEQSARRYACGVPRNLCSGMDISAKTSFSLRGKITKAHGTRQEAFNCKKRYLLEKGYIRVGSREFRSPEGGILVLQKPSKFGGVLRGGKQRRSMPSSHTGGMIY